MTNEERTVLEALPVPETGHLAGVLAVMRKTEIELSTGLAPDIAAIHARFQTIRTRGDAHAYIAEVMEKVRIAREERRRAGKAR